MLDTGVFLAVQAAGAAALEAGESWVPGNVETFRRRRDAAVRALRSEGFDVVAAKATMDLWVPIPTGEPSLDLGRRALEGVGVLLLPERALGESGEGYFRLALTTSEDRLRQAARRLGSILR